MESRNSFLVLLLAFAIQISLSESAKSFSIDYDGNTFVKDGVPIQLVSGSIHYFRVHPTDWIDRLTKLKYAGFNTVQTYIEWSTIEPEPGMFNFSGSNNITRFIMEAMSLDLMVILRPGPFIDAERDMGGLPYWLLREKSTISLRTMDEIYIKFVDRYYKEALLPQIKPLLYSENGPVIMVQVENEYGSYPACDYMYTSHLRDVIREELGEEVLLYSTDGSGTGYLKCGKVPDVYATVDFGSGANLTQTFGAQRLFEPRGPLMNSEFYPGWLDHWGSPHSNVPKELVAESLDAMLALNASVNMYVLHGGTSFGLTAGANLGDTFMACPTSYDYDAPLSEAGDMTLKYYAVRDTIGKYQTLPNMTAPRNSSKGSYGTVPLAPLGSALTLARLTQTNMSVDPLTFEAIGLSNGVAVYETYVNFTSMDPSILEFSAVNDRGYVYVDDVMVGLLDRQQKVMQVAVSIKAGQRLTVVVESQGRVCYGAGINDFKGIVGTVKLGSKELKGWSNTPLHAPRPPTADQFVSKSVTKVSSDAGEMTFYNGTFVIPDGSDNPKDTFLKLDGWTKGIAWVNDFCLGRYWPVMGPQITLYVPHGILKIGSNSITLLELEGAPCTSAGTCSVELTDQHQIDGPTPQY